MKASRMPWSIVILLCATATASYICRVNVSTGGIMLMEEFHLSQIELGRIFSAFLLGYALFQIPAGVLADRWGARVLLTRASWLWVILTSLIALFGWGPFQIYGFTAMTAFIFFRFLLGIAEAPTYTGSGQGVSKWIPIPFQGRANGIILASIGLGSAIAPPLVSSIMITSGWRIALVVSAIPALIVALIWLKVREPEVMDIAVITYKDSPSKTTSLSKNISFYFLTASYSLQGYVGYIFVSWFYIYLVQVRHFNLLTGAWVSSLPWILSLISIPLGGYISDKLAGGKWGPIWGRRIVPMTGMGLSGILISVGAHTNNAGIAALSLALATALVLCVEGPFWAMMMNISGSKSGTAGGMMNMGSNIGGLISPALTPVLASIIGWENALHIAAGLSILAAVLWLGIKPEKA